MADAAAIEGVVWEDSVPFLMARILGNDGAALTQAVVSSIAYTVVDKATPTVIVKSGSLAKATVIFDVLQTDARWTKDATGYNFGAVLDAAAFPDGNHCYWVDIVITPTSGAVIPICFCIQTKTRYTGA